MATSAESDNKPVANAPASDQLPSAAVLADVSEHTVLDKNRNVVKFSALIERSETPKTVVVFIRHFFCGACQAYVQALANELPPSRLAGHSTTLIIIGCGEPELISKYASDVGCPFAIYADPTRKLYELFGFAINIKIPNKSPNYITKKQLTMVWEGVKQALFAGTKANSGGKSSQNGGELLWVHGKLTFIHRMTDTQSHLEVRDLEAVLSQ